MPLTTKDGIFSDGALVPGPTATLGDATHRWSDAYLNNARVGDVTFANGWKITEDGDTILLVRPDGSIARRWA